MKRLIRGARVLDPASGHDAVTDVLIADGRIAALGKDAAGAGAPVFDAGGLWLLPGLVELRAHLPSPHAPAGRRARELRAAAAGGYTTLAAVPDPERSADAELLAAQVRADAGAGPRVVPLAALCAPGDPPQLTELGLLRAAGCAGAVQAGRALPTPVLRRAMQYAAGHGVPVLLDAQDHALAGNGCAHLGPVALRMGLTGIPVAAEELAVARAIALADAGPAPVHLCGLSSAAGVGLVRAARTAAANVSADVGLWHLLHTDDAIAGFDARFHLNPPLRDTADRAALRAALADGTVSVISADHRALGAEAKAQPFARSAPGAAGFEAALALLAGVADAALPLKRIVAALSCAPAALLGVPAGTLRPGAPADVCLFDPAASWTVNADTWRSAGTATPVWGDTLRGRVLATLVDGLAVHDLTGRLS